MEGAKMGVKPPERYINRVALVGAVLLKIIKALSVGMLTISTVIILGGFVSSLPKQDFRNTSIISIFQLLRIFNAMDDDRYTYFMLVLVRHLISMFWPLIQRLTGIDRGSNDRTANTRATPPDSINQWLSTSIKALLNFLAKIIFAVPLIFMVLHPIFAIYFCIVVSISSLRIQHLTDSTLHNLEEASLVFHWLALAQGFIYIIYYIIHIYSNCIVRFVASECSFNAHWGRDAVDQYLSYTKAMCHKDLLFITRDWDMVKFGASLLDSDLEADYLLGARLTVWFIEKGKVIVHLLRFPNRIQKLLSVLAWKKRDEHKELRMMTVKILAHAAQDICIAQHDGLLQRICSLLEPCGKEELLLMQQALLVLDGTANDKQNCIAIYNFEVLFSQITAVGFSEPAGNAMELIEWIDVQKVSLNIILRIICFLGESSLQLCQKIASKLDATRIMSYSYFPEMQLVAIEIFTQLYLLGTIVDQSTIHAIITVTVPLFLSCKEELKQEVTTSSLVVKPEFQEKVGKALVMMSMESKEICEAILLVEENICPQLHQIFCMHNKTAHKVIAAEIFRNLCFHDTTYCSKSMLAKVIQMLIASNKTQHSDHLQAEIEMDSICENQNDGKRLQAALLSTIAAIHSKGLIKGEDFASVISTEAGASEPSFVGLLKEMVERRSSNIGDSLQIAKAVATLVHSMLQYQPDEGPSKRVQEIEPFPSHAQLLKQIRDERIIESLRDASTIIGDVETSMIGVNQQLAKKSFWKTQLRDLVKECAMVATSYDN